MNVTTITKWETHSIKLEVDNGEETNAMDVIMERQFVVKSLKKRLDEEVEDHNRHCLKVREKSLESLKIYLFELFCATLDYCYVCFDAYEILISLTQSYTIHVSFAN